MWREIQSCLRQWEVPSVWSSSSVSYGRLISEGCRIRARLRWSFGPVTIRGWNLPFTDNVDLAGCQLSQKVGSSEDSIVCGIWWPVHQRTTVDPLLSLSLHCTLPLMILSVIQNSNKSTKTNQPKVMLWLTVFLETFSLWRTIYHDYKEQNM